MVAAVAVPVWSWILEKIGGGRWKVGGNKRIGSPTGWTAEIAVTLWLGKAQEMLLFCSLCGIIKTIPEWSSKETFSEIQFESFAEFRWKKCEGFYYFFPQIHGDIFYRSWGKYNKLNINTWASLLKGFFHQIHFSIALDEGCDSILEYRILLFRNILRNL